MAKNNNVKDFAKDIADAIRAKENSVAKINPQDFSARIAALSVGGSPKFAELVSGTLTTIEESDLKDVTYISENAFSGLSYLTSVSIPSNVKTIGKNAFSTCQFIEVLNLSDGLEHIQDGAFSGVPLQTLVLPNTLKTVGKMAFVDAYIDTITIPASVESISDYAFCAGHEMQAVTIESPTPFAIGTRSFPTTAQIYVPYGAYDDYVAQWTDYASQIVRLPAIPSTITVIVNDYTGALVSGASVTISGNGQTYAGTTDGVGTFTQGDLQPATYTISVADMEGFKTPASSEVVVEEDTQNSVTFTYLEKPLFAPTYGVSWTNDASTTMTRTDDAVGMRYTKNTSTGKITSDFDHVFPYNLMKRQVIDGNTFVYVPSMWFRVVADADKKITSVAVSETRGDGDNWYQTKPFYYGAYAASSDGTVLKSVSGANRYYDMTRPTARTRAMAVGTGYHQRDLYAGTILMFLWWIEFATKDSGSIMKGSKYKHTTGNTNTIYNEEEGDNFCVSGYDTSTSQMVWHGIEDYIGNGDEWEDGVTGNPTTYSEYYVSDDYTLYDDYFDSGNMSVLSFNSPTTGSVLEALGWDSTKPFLCQPIAARDDSTYTSGFCDYINRLVNRAFLRHGGSSSELSGGVSAFVSYSVSTSRSTLGCRLMKEV